MNKIFPKEKNRTITRYLRWGIPLIALLTMFVLRGNEVVSTYYLNRGAQALFQEDRQSVAYNLEAALHYQPNNALANRHLAQAYLDLNQPERALEAAQQAILLSPDDALIHLALGDIYDRLGNSEQAITYYESSATENRQTQLAINYLQLADQLWSEGKRKEALTIWRDKARDNEYSSLYANWRLAQYYTGDEATATPYQETARYFPLKSVAPPPDLRLAAYQTQSVLGVVVDKVWTRETLLNVVSYRVWQDQSESTEDILQNILVNNPDDTDIHFYLGELYHRRSDWEKAEAEYRQVLSIDPQYAQAYLRLGMVFESTNSQTQTLNEAANWYKQYHQLAPDDILGLKRLVEICTRLEQTGDAGVNCQNTVALQEEYKNTTDDRRIVAEMLNVPVEDVTLGPNLVENGEFEDWENDKPIGWRLGTYLGRSGDKGLYVAGEDMLVPGETTARIITLWSGTMLDGPTTFAEYTGQNIPVNNMKYLVSLTDCSMKFTKGSRLVFLGEYTRAGGLVLLHESLPFYNGQWRKFRTLVDGPVATTSMIPLIRDWGVGQLCVRSLEVKPVIL